MLDHVEQISAIKVYGAAPYRLRVTGMDGGSLGMETLDLSTQRPGWHVFQSNSLVATNVVELRFEPIGQPGIGQTGKVPEIELWAIDDEQPKTTNVDLTAEELPAGFIAWHPDSKSAELTPSECASFEFNLIRSPAELTRAHLVYKAEGLLRSFALRRTVNGIAEQGGTWLGGDASSRDFVDELDPTTLHVGKNEIALCVPNDATRGVALSSVRLVGALDQGTDLATTISVGEQLRDGNALFDRQRDTSIEIAKDERALVAFDHLVAPDGLVLEGTGVAADDLSSVECIDQKGAAESFTSKSQPATSGVAFAFDGGGKACAALAVTLSASRTISEIDVVGSGAAEPVDWPRIVVTSAPEHFGDSAWVGGFVARPPNMSGRSASPLPIAQPTR